MKRSEINQVLIESQSFFEDNCWALPPNPKWDVTDFGLDNFEKYGLVLINLTEEPEYCEKLMYCRKNQITPAHYHRQKKEDIICRAGILAITFWSADPVSNSPDSTVTVKLNGEIIQIPNDETVILKAGERVTIMPFIVHEFYALSNQCIIGEVSTKNDDLKDNFFSNSNIGRFTQIEEDVQPLLMIVSDKLTNQTL